MRKFEKYCVAQLRAICDFYIRYLPEYCLLEKVFSTYDTANSGYQCRLNRERHTST